MIPLEVRIALSIDAALPQLSGGDPPESSRSRIPRIPTADYDMLHRMIRWVSLVLVGYALSAAAQWIDYPTPGIPRSSDGKPNLSAPAPKAADGKPDLSGLWQRMRNNM